MLSALTKVAARSYQTIWQISGLIPEMKCFKTRPSIPTMIEASCSPPSFRTC
eukprot:c28487_g1_i2 orf=1-153(-)